jgi:hypothetical protein
MIEPATPAAEAVDAPADPAAHKSSSLTFAVANVHLYLQAARLVWRYFWRHGRLPNVANPGTFAERMLWRKVVDHNPQFVIFSDKLATKEFWREQCPDLPVPRVLWVGREACAIPDAILGGDVIVKANHGCAFNLRVRGGELDRRQLCRQARRWMKTEYGRKRGEWAYREVPRKLFVEEAVGDPAVDLYDIGIRACNGRFLLGSIMGRCNVPGHWAIYLDAEGNPVPGMDEPEGAPIPPLPAGLDIREPYRRAIEYARKASAGVDYARFDFLWNGRTLYGGEITCYPGAGSKNPANAWVNHVLMNGWDLKQSHFFKMPQRGWRGGYSEALLGRLRSAGQV